MSPPAAKSPYAGHRFPAKVISQAVWLYCLNAAPAPPSARQLSQRWANNLTVPAGPLQYY